MSIETIFYTQVASIIAFIVALFLLYRVLVQSKDATIENLRSQISYLETKVKDLAETSPDILLQRMDKRTTLLTDELELAIKEKEPLENQVKTLKQQLIQSGAKTEAEKQELVTQLISAIQHASALEAKYKSVESQIREIKEPYLQFLHYANAEVSPGRKNIVGEICSYLGVDYVIESTPEALVKSFDAIYSDVEKNGMHPKMNINGGSMTGLRGVGIISDKNQLTLVGVSVFKTIARELKSNNSMQPTIDSSAD